MPRLKVGVQFYLDPNMLQLINDNVNGKSRSGRIRRLLELGYEVFTSTRRKHEH